MTIQEQAVSRQRRYGDTIALGAMVQVHGLSAVMDMLAAVCEGNSTRAAHVTMGLQERWEDAALAVTAASATMAVALVSP